MIASEEYVPAPDVAEQAFIEPQLTVEEQADVYALDAEAEDAAEHRRPGEMFELHATCGAGVIAKLKRSWEAGGWIVGAFREGEGWRVVFARPHAKQTHIAQEAKNSLDMRERAAEFEEPSDDEVAMLLSARSRRAPRTGCPLLVRMPTRARPEQALDVLAQYREMALGEVVIEVVIDADDAQCNNTRFLQRLAELDCHVVVGDHKTKIEACNHGRIEDWGILVLASDDMVPVKRGWDQRIIEAMDRHWPLRDGALNFNDGYNKDHVHESEPVTCTLPVVGRHLYESVMDGQVYHPEYRSIYCDTDQTFLLTKLNRLVFVDEIIVEHRHFANAKAGFDALYQHNSRHDDWDHNLFEQRHANDFGVEIPSLSILICSIPSRRKMLDRLVSYLRWQMDSLKVEICIDLDPNITVGAKRQRLLERAVGEYVAFVDDDDWVSDDYVSRVAAALHSRPDCASLSGVITENGAGAAKFEHSIKYERWRTVEIEGEPFYERSPNHLNAIKRELALQVGFVAKNVGEDHDFSTRLKPLLTVEASAGNAPLYYYWSMPERSVQRRK